MPIHPSHLEKLDLSIVREKLLRQLLLKTTTTSAITEGPISKLRSLHISFIDDLDTLQEEAVRNLDTLEHLNISFCNRLTCVAAVSEEEEEGFRAFTSLHSLSIAWCDSLTSLSGLTQHLTALQTLTIEHCKNFDFSGHDHGAHWQGMRSLRNLQIVDIPKLVSLPLGLQQVTTLQHLHITLCPGLMALPDWISNLTSLQHLTISDCPGLMALPEQLSNLSSLKSLHISNCPLLTIRCQKETGEDWSKISHIPFLILIGQPKIWTRRRRSPLFF